MALGAKMRAIAFAIIFVGCVIDSGVARHLGEAHSVADTVGVMAVALSVSMIIIGW